MPQSYARICQGDYVQRVTGAQCSQWPGHLGGRGGVDGDKDRASSPSAHRSLLEHYAHSTHHPLLAPAAPFKSSTPSHHLHLAFIPPIHLHNTSVAHQCNGSTLYVQNSHHTNSNLVCRVAAEVPESKTGSPDSHVMSTVDQLNQKLEPFGFTDESTSPRRPL